MKGVSRRQMISGAASLALLPLVSQLDIGRAFVASRSSMPDAVQWKLDTLIECLARFREVEHQDIATRQQLRDWQLRYDRLVGAADAVRDIITDDMPGRDRAVAIANTCLRPSCERAHLYWLNTLGGMSREFGAAGHWYYGARLRQVISIAATQRVVRDQIHELRHLTDAVRALQVAIPVTKADRFVVRCMIESLNNDDMVDVSIARNTLQPWEVGRDFADWARPCGNFTCKACSAWLDMELVEIEA